jgi:hypothetical protein
MCRRPTRLQYAVCEESRSFRRISAVAGTRSRKFVPSQETLEIKHLGQAGQTAAYTSITKLRLKLRCAREQSSSKGRTSPLGSSDESTTFAEVKNKIRYDKIDFSIISTSDTVKVSHMSDDMERLGPKFSSGQLSRHWLSSI